MIWILESCWYLVYHLARDPVIYSKPFMKDYPRCLRLRVDILVSRLSRVTQRTAGIAAKIRYGNRAFSPFAEFLMAWISPRSGDELAFPESTTERRHL